MPTNHSDRKPLSSRERAILFKTRIVAVQLQRYIEAKGRVTLKQLSATFPDIGGRSMYDRVKNLQDRGIVYRDGDEFLPTFAVDPCGSKADAAWRAARLLAASSFTPDQLAALASIEREHAATLCRNWCNHGLLVKIGQMNRRVPLYKMISKDVVRPIIKQERKHG